MPPSSQVGYAVMRTLCLKSYSSGSFIMSTQAPVDVELPAVIDAAQAAFLVAPEIQRDAAMRAELLDQADAALACRGTPPGPRRAGGRAPGGPSGSAISRESSAGIQYMRIALPIGVPWPTRVMSSFSSRDSIGVLLAWIAESLDPGRSGDNAGRTDPATGRPSCHCELHTRRVTPLPSAQDRAGRSEPFAARGAITRCHPAKGGTQRRQLGPRFTG